MKTKSLFNLWAVSSLLGTTLAACSRAGFDSCMASPDIDLYNQRQACNSRPTGICIGKGCSKAECVAGVTSAAVYSAWGCAQNLCAGDQICLSKAENIFNTHISSGGCSADCGIGNAAISCWDDRVVRCREAFATGTSNLCDPCQPASNNCLAQSSTNRANGLALCSGRATPAQVTVCRNALNSHFDNVDNQCRTCVATCAASLPPPGSPYTCPISPCQAATTDCFAASSTNRTIALTTCNGRPTPRLVASCKNVQTITFDDVDDQCIDCTATCTASMPAPGTTYTCTIV